MKHYEIRVSDRSLFVERAGCQEYTAQNQNTPARRKDELAFPASFALSQVLTVTAFPKVQV